MAASAKTGTRAVGAGFCSVGYRQAWPGEANSLNIKGIETTHFWAQIPVINNCARCACAVRARPELTRAPDSLPQT